MKYRDLYNLIQTKPYFLSSNNYIIDCTKLPKYPILSKFFVPSIQDSDRGWNTNTRELISWFQTKKDRFHDHFTRKEIEEMFPEYFL